MADDQNRIVEILVKYALYEPLAAEEARLLEEWRSQSVGHDELPDQLRDPEWIAEHRRLLKNNPAPIVLLSVVSPYRIGWRGPVMAVVFALLIVGGWMLLRPRVSSLSRSGVSPASGAAPAGVRAYLTREDGAVVVLDTMTAGRVLERTGGVLVRLKDESTLSYEGYNNKESRTTVSKQRLVVAPGAGPWRILLADGSRVVLNSGSSLEFSPDLRSGRPVLDGEAWFGVARDASRPLLLELAGGTEVRVLGTTFAILASDGGTKVLLYSGALRVRQRDDSLLLRPGQAAVVAGSGLTGREMEDPERALAWRGKYVEEEFFDFEDANLPVILQELAEWYGVQVSNPESIQGVAVTGKLPRSLSLDDMLGALERVEKGHARMKVQENSIVVQPGKPGG